MNKNFTKYTCTECGQMHEEWPALTYGSPTYYHNLTEVEKQTIGELNDDFCIVKQPDQTHRFIRCTLSQKIMGQ